MGIRILLVDDHELLAKGVGSVLERAVPTAAVEVVATGREAVERVRRNPSLDLVVLDVSLPDMDGVEVTEKILDECPRQKILCFSMHDETVIRLRMLEAGVRGYLNKGCTHDEFVRTVLSLVARGSCADAIAGPGGPGPDGWDATKPLRAAEVDLTPTERRVLKLIAEGCSTCDIAQKLGRSVKTIGTHRANIMSKLDTRSVADLTKFAIREGLSPLKTPPLRRRDRQRSSTHPPVDR